MCEREKEITRERNKVGERERERVTEVACVSLLKGRFVSRRCFCFVVED